MDAITRPPAPVNETIRTYRPGSVEQRAVADALAMMSGGGVELPMTIGGVRRMGDGARIPVVAPHRHQLVLGTTTQAGPKDVEDALR